MVTTWTRMAGLLIATCGVLTLAPSGAAAQSDNGYTNLQVLPADVSRAELGEIMLENLRALGLPRRAGEGCLHCHAGSLDIPRGQWDYASDEKPAKEQARVMMAMVREINDSFVARLEHRRGVEVGCTTCHAGRLNPMPLDALLISEYEDGGVEALEETYRSARQRYFASDAYDFRVSMLVDVANRLTTRGLLDDAARVHALNVEYYGDPAAHAGLMRLRLFQALESGGPEAMIERYERLRGEHPPEAFQPLMLDALAWQLYRSGRREPAMLLFELNFDEHPETFPANESLAYAVFGEGDEERGLEIARAWLRAHPDHRGGQQLLTELERMRGG